MRASLSSACYPTRLADAYPEIRVTSKLRGDLQASRVPSKSVALSNQSSPAFMALLKAHLSSFFISSFIVVESGTRLSKAMYRSF